MEVRLNGEAEDLEDQMTYLYKYELRCGSKAPLTIHTVFEPAAVVPVMEAGETLPSLMDSPLIST